MKLLSKGEYYGHEQKAVSHNGILLSKYDYCSARTDWHYHENPYFMYVLKGNMKDCNKKEKTLCPSGSLMYNNWQEPHYGSKHSKTAGGFHLEFERSWLETHGLKNHLLEEGSELIRNPKIHILFAKLFNEMMLFDEFSALSVEVLLAQICDELSAHRKMQVNKQPSWIKKLKEILHFDDCPKTLAHLSQMLNVHPVHISRAAPKFLSMSLGEYLRMHKISNAIPLLFDASHSLTEIAYHSGFSDQSHFNRVLRLILV